MLLRVREGQRIGTRDLVRLWVCGCRFPDGFGFVFRSAVSFRNLRVQGVVLRGKRLPDGLGVGFLGLWFIGFGLGIAGAGGQRVPDGWGQGRPRGSLVRGSWRPDPHAVYYVYIHIYIYLYI